MNKLTYGHFKVLFYTNWFFFLNLKFNFDGLIVVINAAHFITKMGLCKVFFFVEFDPFCNVRCPPSECPLWVPVNIVWSLKGDESIKCLFNRLTIFKVD